MVIQGNSEFFHGEISSGDSPTVPVKPSFWPFVTIGLPGSKMIAALRAQGFLEETERRKSLGLQSKIGIV
jgi:hypothetical protein